MEEGNEENKPLVAHVETAQEKEFIESCDDVPAVPKKLLPLGETGTIPVNRLTEQQLDEACDRIVMGSSIYELANELRVSSRALARVLKERMGTLYLRRWQQSIKFDCLRAEAILKTAMGHLDEAPKWGKLALEVLSYRARVLGFENARMEETTIRVAGMSQSEIFAEIKKKL